MKCLDFDHRFEQYLKDWIKNNGERYGNNMDVIETLMPDIYMEFLNHPADWLGGTKPIDYFEQFSDAQQLVLWMCEYDQKNVSVPDLLLERIVSLGEKSEKELLKLFNNDAVLDVTQMTAISLLRELDSCEAMQLYIDYVANAKEESEKADMCAESLVVMGEQVVEPILQKIQEATETGKDLFADVLSNFPGNSQICQLLIERFKYNCDKRALFASYLAKLGDSSALKVLEDAANDRSINYLDYIEIINAIEALGGERPAEREFSGDVYYESLKRV